MRLFSFNLNLICTREFFKKLQFISPCGLALKILTHFEKLTRAN